MYTLAVYYKGPFKVQRISSIFFDKPPLIGYDFNPLLYNPRGFFMYNFGCSRMTFTPENRPSDKAKLESKVKEVYAHNLRWNKKFRLTRRLQAHGLQFIAEPLNDIMPAPEDIEIIVIEDNEE